MITGGSGEDGIGVLSVVLLLAVTVSVGPVGKLGAVVVVFLIWDGILNTYQV